MDRKGKCVGQIGAINREFRELIEEIGDVLSSPRSPEEVEEGVMDLLEDFESRLYILCDYAELSPKQEPEEDPL